MPAPVPPGYTRGPLVLMAAPIATDDNRAMEERLRQWLWREAGGYGARLVVITVEPAFVKALTTLGRQMVNWECDQIVEIVALDRMTARNEEQVAHIEQATGIVLLGEEPLRWAAILGGTPLAQAIRRAHARGKLVAGMGAVSAFLCQHIISPTTQPKTLREMVTFGAGLGLVNRLVVDAATVARPFVSNLQPYLLAAVASNPFLIGVGLAAGSAAILYPDNTLQAIGPNPMTIVDGQSIEAAELDIASEKVLATQEPLQTIAGALYYILHTGDGFNLDDHSVRPVGEVDLPPTGPVTSVF